MHLDIMFSTYFSDAIFISPLSVPITTILESSPWSDVVEGISKDRNMHISSILYFIQRV